MRLRVFTIMSLAAIAGCSSVTPRHDVRTHPDHIRAGVQKGDTVEVTTIDGREYTFEVVRVSAGGIEGPFGQIPFNEIDTVVKRSWTPPALACGGSEPVGCSIPSVILMLSTEFQKQADKFHPACETHDFCYRHGYATYGDTRENCDTIFYDDMNVACDDANVLGVLSALDFGLCKGAANQIYEAVRKHGEEHFRTTNSTYCEWRWPK